MSSLDWIPNDATDEERELLERKIMRGADVDSVPRIPNAPDISEPPPPPKGPKRKSGPNDEPEGLVELKASELPVPGRHFVVWGSAYLSDIRPRSVKKTAPRTENEHAKIEVEHTKRLLEYKLKNPIWKGKDRVRRTEEYARWRYKGYVCGEVVSL